MKRKKKKRSFILEKLNYKTNLAKKIMQGVKMKLIKVTRRRAVGKKIMMLQVYTVQVNLLRGVQLEALVVLAVKVPAVAVQQQQ